MANPILDGLTPNGQKNIQSVGTQVSNPILNSIQPQIAVSQPPVQKITPQATPKYSIWDTVKNFGNAVLKTVENVPSYIGQATIKPLSTGEGFVTPVLKTLGFGMDASNYVLGGLESAISGKKQTPFNVFSQTAKAISNKIGRASCRERV